MLAFFRKLSKFIESGQQDAWTTFHRLCIFLAWKNVFFLFLHIEPQWPVSSEEAGVVFTFVVGSVLVVRGKTLLFGAAALAAGSIFRAVQLFPWTPNHYLLESAFWIAITLGLTSKRPQETASQLLRLAGFLIIAAFFWGGVQKAVRGFWFSGEYLLHTAAFGPSHSTLASVLRACLGLFFPAVTKSMNLAQSAGNAFGDHPRSVLMEIPQIETMRSFFKWIGTPIVAAELLLPSIVIFRPKWRWALHSLFSLQVAVALSTGIWSFGFLGCALMTSFYGPDQGKVLRHLWFALFAAIIFLVINRLYNFYPFNVF